MGFRISVDTGGTFTDVVVADEAGALHLAKAPTDLARAFQSIEDGARRSSRPSCGLTVPELLARTDVFTYGTTRATNAIVEGRTARTAFFTTEGFPDILLLREGGKLEPFRQLPYPPPYVPRYLTFEIRERIDSEGDVFVALDEASVLDAIAEARRLGRRGGRRLPALVDRQPGARAARRRAARARVAGRAVHALAPAEPDHPRVPACLVDGDRRVAQAADAGVPADDGARPARRPGFAGDLFVATSFGGAWRPQEVVERPIYSVGSGPSMAPVAALTYARAETPRQARPDRLRHRRHDLRRRARLGRRDQLHARRPGSGGAGSGTSPASARST